MIRSSRCRRPRNPLVAKGLHNSLPNDESKFPSSHLLKCSTQLYGLTATSLRLSCTHSPKNAILRFSQNCVSGLCYRSSKCRAGKVPDTRLVRSLSWDASATYPKTKFGKNGTAVSVKL